MSPNGSKNVPNSAALNANKEDAEDTFHECDENPEPSKNKEEETEDEYRLRVYGTTDKHGDTNGPSRRGKLVRSYSKRLSRELSRRASAVEEALPKTPSGWAIFLSTIAAATVGYEVSLQFSLTAPPLVFGQYESGALDPIYRYLTRSKEAILSRKIKPSLFIGTRSMIASTGAFLLGGPVSKEEHLTFREILTMSQDGATIAIDWELPIPDEYSPGSAAERKAQILSGLITQPVVLILHGINNDSSFGYIRTLMRACAERGWIAVGMNFRGCGGVPLTTPRGYTGAYTGDIRGVIHSISARLAKGVPMFLVGNSLGANLITKYLGEEGLSDTLPECIAGGISLGNPLHIHSDHIAFPWDHLLSLGARKGILLHLRHFLAMKSPYFQSRFRKALLARTIADFDNAMAPIFIRNEPDYPFSTRVGYNDGEAYWKDASSYRYIRYISVPLLQLISQDDFLVYKGNTGKMLYPLSNPNVMVVKTKCGGHLGWKESPPDTGNMFGFGTSWADTATTEFIEGILRTRDHSKKSADRSPASNLRERSEIPVSFPNARL